MQHFGRNGQTRSKTDTFSTSIFAIYTAVSFPLLNNIVPHSGCRFAQGLKFVPFSKPKMMASSWPENFTCTGTWQFLAFCCTFCIRKYVRFIRDVLNLLTCILYILVKINHGVKRTVKQLQDLDAQGGFARAVVDLNGVQYDMVVTSAAAFDFARKLCDEYDRRKKDLFAFYAWHHWEIDARFDCKFAARKKKLWIFPKRKNKGRRKTKTKMASASTSESICWNLEFQSKTHSLMAGMGQAEKWPRSTMQNMKTPWKNLTDKRKNKNMNVARLQKYVHFSLLIFNCMQSLVLVAVELRQKTWSCPMVYLRPWTWAQLPATTYWLLPRSCKRMAESWHVKNVV